MNFRSNVGYGIVKENGILLTHKFSKMDHVHWSSKKHIRYKSNSIPVEIP